MSRLGSMALLGVALAIGACAPGCSSRVVPTLYTPAYSLNEFSYAAGGRDLRTDVYGNPFAMDPQAFARAVTQAMAGHHFGPRTNFTTTPGDSARPLYRVVMAFNPAAAIPSPALCEGGEIPAQPAGPSIEVQAAFCRGGGVLSAVSGYLDQASGPDDPAFRALIADITRSLFPSDNPMNRGDADPCGFLGGC